MLTWYMYNYSFYFIIILTVFNRNEIYAFVKKPNNITINKYVHTKLWYMKKESSSGMVHAKRERDKKQEEVRSALLTMAIG